MSTGIVLNEIFEHHDTGGHHPESPGRIHAIRSYLEETPLLKKLVSLDPQKAKPEDILRVHDKTHLENIQKTDGKSGNLDPDTVFSEESYPVSLLAAGSGLSLANEILKGKLDNGMAIVRPPGHHAEEDHSMGFCLFNNIAITARYLQSKGIQKIAILDWDVHHGNGTEHTFYEDPDVLFISTHQYPFYPGTGHPDDIGRGAGQGTNLNIALPSGSGNEDYFQAFRERVIPSMEDFEPEFLLISAGFDAHRRDPLAGMKLTTSAFEKFTFWSKEFARDYCQGRMLSFLEGGYDLEALSECVGVHLGILFDG